MKRYLWLAAALSLLLPAAALAQASGGDLTIGGVLDVIKGILGEFKQGAYLPAVSGIIVVIMYVWRRWLSTFVLSKVTSKWWLSFIPMLLSLVATVPPALVVSPFDWKGFLINTFVTGAQAIAIWQLLGKAVLDKVGLLDKMKDGEAASGSTWK